MLMNNFPLLADLAFFSVVKAEAKLKPLLLLYAAYHGPLLFKNMGSYLSVNKANGMETRLTWLWGLFQLEIHLLHVLSVSSLLYTYYCLVHVQSHLAPAGKRSSSCFDSLWLDSLMLLISVRLWLMLLGKLNLHHPSSFKQVISD